MTCCVVHGGGGKTGCTRRRRQLSWGHCKARDCFGLLWLALAGAFVHTPPRDASGDGLWVAEQAEGGAMGGVLGSAVGRSTDARRCPVALTLY